MRASAHDLYLSRVEDGLLPLDVGALVGLVEAPNDIASRHSWLRTHKSVPQNNRPAEMMPKVSTACTVLHSCMDQKPTLTTSAVIITSAFFVLPVVCRGMP